MAVVRHFFKCVCGILPRAILTLYCLPPAPLSLSFFFFFSFFSFLVFDAAQKRYGPFAKKMVATFKHYLMKKGIIANSIMVEDPSLTEEEVASFEAACASCDFRPADEE